MSTGDAEPDSGNSAKRNSSIKEAGPRLPKSAQSPAQEQAAAGRDSNRPDGGSLPRSVEEALQAMARGGPMDAETANRLLSQALTGQARRAFLDRLAHAWVKQNPEAAADWANQLEGSDRRHVFNEILHRWADADPAAAANYLTRLPTSEQNLHLVHALANKWAERDQAAAMDWASAQTDPAKRERSMGGVVSAWSDTDPKAAADFAVSIESQFERNRVLEVAARRWASQDTAAAMAWAQGLPSAERQQATRAILREVAEDDPSRAAEIFQNIAASLPAEAQQSHDYRHIAHEIASLWASSNPQEAARWAVKLPEGTDYRRSAIASVADQWLQISPAVAGEWILQLPEGPVRDIAAERVVRTTMSNNPSLSFQWANSLSEPGPRIGMMRQVLDRWNAIDPVSAQAALSTANVSAEQRIELGRVFGEGK